MDKYVDELDAGDIVLNEEGHAELLVEAVKITAKTVTVTYFSGVVEPGRYGRGATFNKRYHRPENYPATSVKVSL